MPIYEYACTACGERTEAKQGFDDPPLEECPHCGGKLRKLYSPVGIVFKGSGFYSTDTKGSKTSDKGGDKKPAQDSSKPAEKKPDKPATTSEKSA
ncbi:MAG: FmdB family transcriptional regulator [Actinomycetota bacterium]|nr:FmdB family transcriptional regulator [Actinomycetota bacterium]